MRAWLLVAKYALRDGEQLEALDGLIQALGDAQEDFPFLLRYIVETFPSYDEAELRRIIRHVRPEEEEQMMSQFAQKMLAKGEQKGRRLGWREGRQEGRQEGWREGEAALLLRLLQRRFGTLPDWVAERVGDASPEMLEAWFDQALDATTLEGLFG